MLIVLGSLEIAELGLRFESKKISGAFLSLLQELDLKTMDAVIKTRFL